VAEDDIGERRSQGRSPPRFMRPGPRRRLQDVGSRQRRPCLRTWRERP
jgi:hypothetical protein